MWNDIILKLLIIREYIKTISKTQFVSLTSFENVAW
jgi:hypothetical protein